MRAIALPSGWRLFAAQAGLLMTAIALRLTAKRALYQRRNATALS
ncbi:hypothetical protein [Pseudomonas putida]|nr:hypothetical protein [Pseudomonas putida]